MPIKEIDSNVPSHIRKLSQARKALLKLEPAEALARILDADQPAALVHSLSAEDFYFLVHDIGTADALPLLNLASDQQCEYLLDLEAWHKDRMDNAGLSLWLDLLFKANPSRFMRWFVQEKTEFLKHYLYTNIEIYLRPHDQEASEIPEGFQTRDDVLYYRLRRLPPDLQAAEPEAVRQFEKERQAFIDRFLDQMIDLDMARYQTLMLEAAAVLPAEIEEEAFRRRNVRLAEKGFMAFDDAVGLYQSLKANDLPGLSAKVSATPQPLERYLPVPTTHAGVLEGDSLFARTLRGLDDGALLQQLQTEFAGLCNRIISADKNPIRDRKQLQPVVRKAAGYLSIGLETAYRRQDAPETPIEAFGSTLITRHPLERLFRVGYGCALDLKWRAERWRKTGWFTQVGLTPAFWDEHWLGVLGGLLIKRPMFYDSRRKADRYREFETLEEIENTAAVLRHIIAMDNLLARLDPPIATADIPPGMLPTYKNLILTLWGREELHLGKDLQPIPLDTFRPFFEDLFEPAATGTARTTRNRRKEDLMAYLAAGTGLDACTLGEEVGRTLENLFREIERELGRVAAADLDPRFVQLFMLA